MLIQTHAQHISLWFTPTEFNFSFVEVKITDYPVPKDIILFIKQITERKLKFLQLRAKIY